MLLARSPITLHARRRARVEIIPLIDVIFFLLATFVLFTLSMRMIKVITVNLPVGGEGRDQAEILTLQVSGEDSVFWNGEPMLRRELPDRLARYREETNRPRVLVTSDDRATLGGAVAVLDDVRHAGIAEFTVETRMRPTGR